MKIVEYAKGSITEVENVFKIVESGAQGPPGAAGTIGTLDLLDPKTTPIDADLMLVGDSTDSFANKSTTWANLKATLKAFFDTLYAAIGHTILSHDTTGTGAELTELTDGSETTLHNHAGGGGGEWTEIARETVSGTPQFIDFLDKLTDTYDIYRLEYIGYNNSSISDGGVQVGTGVTPSFTTTGYASVVDASISGQTSYNGDGGNSQNITFAANMGGAGGTLDGEIILYNARSATLPISGRFEGVFNVAANSIRNRTGIGGLIVAGGPYDHLRVDVAGFGTIASGLLILSGKSSA